jgi:hypothetical protein
MCPHLTAEPASRPGRRPRDRRVLAHEIGHVLLRSKQHAGRGLMRAVQRADELVDPARNRYRAAR